MLLRHFFALGLLALDTSAHAACSAQARYALNFSDQPVTALSYGGSTPFVASNPAGQSSNVTVSFQAYNMASSLILLTSFPRIDNVINNGSGGNFLVVGGSFAARTPDIAANARVFVTTFTFATPVRDVTIPMSDIDYSGGVYRDWIRAIGKNGGNSFVPTITTPSGQSNNGTLTNATSTVKLGPSGSPIAVGFGDAVGIRTNDNGSTKGDMVLSFEQPVTSVEVRYGNYPLQGLELLTGSQLIGFAGVSFCPMPVLKVSKTASPYATAANDPNRFAIPGSDILYAVTVTNADDIPIDLNTLVLNDSLPPQVSFYNGDVDDGGPLTTNYQFDPGGSGLTLTTTNLGYSNNGGASYGYTPAAGYDASVNALRFMPTGTLAANSSFSIRFRARIR